MKNILFFFFLFLLIACRKETFTSDPAARLSTTTDTLRFDTVFTTVGAVTQQLKIFNLNKKGIRITSIRLKGGAASPFKININGTPGPTVQNLEIAANDSVYVFVTVHIDPTAVTTPFLVQDSLELEYNGNLKKVQLEAYGQNAHFLRKYKITANTVWTNDLPYVLLDTFLIAANMHLAIQEGCRIYLHANSPFVVEGRLTVQGKPENSTRVVFTTDRLDAPYRDLPGSWPGMIFRETSSGSRMQYAVLKNAVQAIAVLPSATENKLHLSETIIDNASDAGLIANAAHLTAQNLLVRNCGKGIVLQNGGDYQFLHATVAGFSTPWLPHKEPVLTIANTSTGTNARSLNAIFRNCIFWGESGGVVPEEVVVAKDASSAFHLLFDGVLWPLSAPPEGATVTQAPATQEPEFDSIDIANKFYDFHLKESSPARNSGVPAGVSLDLDGRPRPVGAPDLGAYEEQ